MKLHFENRLFGAALRRCGQNIRPTMLLLAGLTDDYAHDGRALVEALTDSALPKSLRGINELEFLALSVAYKQINAPVGLLGAQSLAASTQALAGDDATYASIEGKIAALTTERDALATTMLKIIEDAEFNGKPLDSKLGLKLVVQAGELIAKAARLTR
jgi:hypothetical protein